MNGDIYINNSDGTNLISPFGRKFTISDNFIAREERTASGRLVRDIIATKKKFTLDYALIDTTNLNVFLSLYDSEVTVKIYNDTGYTDYTCLMQPVERERIALLGDGIWGGVKVELNEC